MKEEYRAVIEEYSVEETNKDLFMRALKEIMPNRKNFLGWIIAVVCSSAIILDLQYSANSLKLIEELVEFFSTIQLGILGVVFTVYSILLVFLSKKYIKITAIMEKNLTETGKSVLKDFTDYYEIVLFLNFFALLFTVIIYIVVRFGVELYIFLHTGIECILLNRCLDVFLNMLLWLYILFSIRIIYEIKSLIYNTRIVFRMSMVINLIDIGQEDDREENKE